MGFRSFQDGDFIEVLAGGTPREGKEAPHTFPTPCSRPLFHLTVLEL